MNAQAQSITVDVKSTWEFSIALAALHEIAKTEHGQRVVFRDAGKLRVETFSCQESECARCIATRAIEEIRKGMTK